RNTFFLKPPAFGTTLSNRTIFASRFSFAAEKAGRPNYFAGAEEFSLAASSPVGNGCVPGDQALAVSSGLGAGEEKERVGHEETVRGVRAGAGPDAGQPAKRVGLE